MQISKEALEEFKEIYKKEFGVELSDSDTLDKATRLLTLMKHVYRPITKEDMKLVEERRSEIGARQKSK